MLLIHARAWVKYILKTTDDVSINSSKITPLGLFASHSKSLSSGKVSPEYPLVSLLGGEGAMLTHYPIQVAQLFMLAAGIRRATTDLS